MNKWTLLTWQLVSSCSKSSKPHLNSIGAKSRLNFAHGTFRAQASDVCFGPADDRSNNAKDNQNVFEGSSINDGSSKIAKPLNRIPYPISIALVFSLIAFLKGGPSSVLAAISKSGFTAAFTLIFVSEIGDKSFVMVITDASALCGLPTALPIGEYAAVTLLLFFGLRSIKDAWDLPSDVVTNGNDSSPELDELTEAEELVKEKVSKRLINPLDIIWKSFSLVFFAEWGDRSMLATIALGGAQSPWGVASGAIAGHFLATCIAILGGAILANYISEKLVGYLGGGLFLIFAFATFFGVF
ncbi:unnamed protein product [Lupinus luteus]|uniref:GDT1 family protein n=1 Tax=Lupinus luteus TaxID=3873 RepID=A0AAV1W226_LUPLU